MRVKRTRRLKCVVVGEELARVKIVHVERCGMIRANGHVVRHPTEVIISDKYGAMTDLQKGLLQEPDLGNKMNGSSHFEVPMP